MSAAPPFTEVSPHVTSRPGSPRHAALRPDWHEAITRIVAVTALIYGLYWISWRWWNTINPHALFPSLLLLVAETWAYVNLALFVMLTWKLTHREPGPAPPGRSVDVFITCYDEPLEVLRRTAIGARNIRYPHRTYLLDDGKREDVREMAAALGIGYIRRPGKENAKAGNLNHALRVTSGEFILQLDADHVPLPTIIDRMLGYFNDPKMAVVQSPQDFYNVDSFTHVVNDEGRRLWEENRIFYSLIQPGRDHWNASFFCGSCGVIRRSALEEIGGFATQTIIEDMETTIRLHQAGYKSGYHPETLAYGLAPGAAGAYHVQRLRWGQGAMQVLRKLKPLTAPRLTLAQRLNYFAGTAAYFEGWQKAIFYAMPLVYFYTGVLPVGGTEREFIVRLVPYVLIAILAFELLSRGTGYLLLSERFTMVRVWTYMMATLAIFTRKPLRFNVTPKGKYGVPRSAYMPQLVLLIASVIAPVWATIAYTHGWISYTSTGWHALAFWVNGVWCTWNAYFAWWVVRHSLQMKQQRDDHRFAGHLGMELRVAGDAMDEVLPAVSADLNPSGMAVRAMRRLEPGTRVSLRLPIPPQPVEIIGEVRHVREEESRTGTVYVHGVQFIDLPLAGRDAIEVYCTQHAMPMWRLRYRQSIDILVRMQEIVRNVRGERRRLAGLPVRVRVHDADDEQSLSAVMILEEISRHGARILGSVPIDPGMRVSFDVPGSTAKGTGIVRYVQILETPIAVLYGMGIALDEGVPHPIHTESVRGTRWRVPRAGRSLNG